MEQREKRAHVRSVTYSQFGRSYCYIDCPFCGATTKAFIWSLSGSGKKCACGAMHTSLGVTLAAKIKTSILNHKQ